MNRYFIRGVEVSAKDLNAKLSELTLLNSATVSDHIATVGNMVDSSDHVLENILDEMDISIENTFIANIDTNGYAVVYEIAKDGKS